MSVHWSQLFVPSGSIVEILIRGTVMYLVLFALMRLILRREIGSLGVNDLLVVVLIADAAQNGMAGDYQSVPEGLLLVGTIIGWAWSIDWLAYHVPVAARFLRPPKLKLIENGRLLRRNMRRELVTLAELEMELRRNDIESFEHVRVAYLESDGTITMLKQEPESSGQGRRPHRI